MILPYVKSGLFSLLLTGFLSFSAMCTAQEVVNFRLPDLQGQLQDIAQYRGKWLVVNFWATWCGPCVAEIPELNAFEARRKQQANVIGIAFEKTPVDQIRRFVQQFNITYPILLIGEQPLVPLEPLKGLPSTFLLSPRGEYLHAHVGPVTVGQLEELLDQFAGDSSN
ncbi:TlpA family protein disulfide reductase [Gammaproteobacteria bacterium]|jgi:thiol-disulfide isomerase/thioredoxin|nr:TlpA family protein disulfide reductase [Gammaproteobacteria bacterium]MDG2237026.1 TlpA disulfide reductase family protein [Arenicellales bacterium]